MSRIFVLIILFTVLSAMLVSRLFQLQIVEGESYLNNFKLKIRKERTISSTRGNIYDRNGERLAYNELAYSVTIEDVYESGEDKNKNLNACIIHPSGIIGPYDYGNSHLTELVREVSNGKLFATVKGGYDFVDVRDVAAAIITASKKDNKGECYILSNRYITIKELSDLICDVQGIKKIKIVLPICLAKIIAPFFEAYYNLKKQTPLFTKYSLYTLSSNSNFSNKKAKEELGYKNRDMKDTIKDTISWLNKGEEK